MLAKPSKIILVVVAYYLSGDTLRKFVDDIRNRTNASDVIVILNSISTIPPNFFEKLHVITGTNLKLDISGYLEAYLYAKSNLHLQKNEIFVFANDSIARKHNLTLLAKSANLFLLKMRSWKFYSGVSMRLKLNNGEYFTYISTYFVITNVASIEMLYKDFISNFRSYRRRLNSVLSHSFDYSWRPAGDVIVTRKMLRNKRFCVFVEMSFSLMAKEKGMYFSIPFVRLIKFSRFLIKIRNYFGKKIL